MVARRNTVATRAAVKPVVEPLANNAEPILKKLGVYYETDTGQFVEDEDARRVPEPFKFFQHGDSDYEDEEIATLPHTCAVLVFGGFLDPSVEFDADLTMSEKEELFKYAVQQELRNANRKQAVATTTQNQTFAAAMLAAAGFKPAGTSKNPGSGNDVTIWVLSI